MKLFSTAVVILSLAFAGYIGVSVHNTITNVSHMVDKAAAAAQVE